MKKDDKWNYERTWKTVICLNPDHELIRYETNEVGNIPCPICDSLMVVEIKPRWELYGKHSSK